jgi:hypothetical protein
LFVSGTTKEKYHICVATSVYCIMQFMLSTMVGVKKLKYLGILLISKSEKKNLV